ncbi:MAG: hypothetical protein DLM58_14310 [Pseudonocardiales bacterium]|nr:MAG: hypothetical protein DLM58_14310 [Pseudonocardiales bacterium]
MHDLDFSLAASICARMVSDALDGAAHAASKSRLEDPRRSSVPARILINEMVRYVGGGTHLVG